MAENAPKLPDKTRYEHAPDQYLPGDELLLQVYKIMPIEYTWLIISSPRSDP
jgi:hypothetical protein